MPTDNFGPWTTSLTTGSRMELSAFWKKRLARLADAAASTTRLSLPRAIALECAIAILAIAPHWERPVLSGPVDGVRSSESPDVTAIPDNGIDEAVLGQSRRVRALLDEPTTADFNDVSIAEALRRLSVFHKIEVRFDVDAIKLAGRSLDTAATAVQFSGLSLRSALKLILEPEALGYYVESGELVISSRGNAWLIEEDYDIRGLVRAGIRPKELAAAIPFLVVPASWESAGGGGELRVDEQMLKVVQRREVRENLRNLLDSIQQAVRQLRGPLNNLPTSTRRYSIADLRRQGIPDEELQSYIDRRLINALRLDRPTEVQHEITGDEMIVRNQSEWGHSVTVAFLSELRALRRDGPAHALGGKDFWRATQAIDVATRGRALLRVLQHPVSIDIVDMPFRKALGSMAKTMAEVGQFNLIVDPDIHMQGTHLPKTPVTLHAKDEACSSVLDRFCTQFGLVWRVHDEVVWIANATTDNPRRVPRAYSTKGLVTADRTDREIAETILNEIEPQSWGTRDDRGRLYPLSGVIVVMHNEGVQWRVERWLESQRKE